MRFFVCTVALIFAVLGLGCSQTTPPAATLRIGIGAQPATLDPQLMRGLSELKILSACFEGLVILSNTDPSGVEPGVAQSWEISEDERTYTFHLRNDAKWSDGKPVTAGDFVWALERGLSPELAAPHYTLGFEIVGAQEFFEGKASFEKVGYRALDEHTLQITIKEPSPVFLRNLTSQFFYPLRKDIIEANGKPTSRANHWATPGNMISNGPFVLIQNKVYRYAKAVRNEHYWDKVGLGAIEFYPIDNRASEEIAFLSGNLDITLALPLPKVTAYKNDPRLRIDNALQVEMVLLNVKRPPLERKEIRQALSLALNRSAICEELLKAGQRPAFNLVPPGISGGYIPQPILTEDIKKAQVILTEEDKKTIGALTYCFNTSEARKAIAETLQAQWSTNLGAQIGLENMEWKTYLQMRSAHDFDMTRTGWSADVDDPSDFLNLFVSHSPNNHTGWSNPNYDEAVAQRNFATAEAILMEELPAIPLYFNPNVYLISPRVKGWENSAMDLRPWKRVWIED